MHSGTCAQDECIVFKDTIYGIVKNQGVIRLEKMSNFQTAEAIKFK